MKHTLLSIALILTVCTTGWAQSGEEYVQTELTESPDQYTMMYVSDLSKLLSDPGDAPVLFRLELRPTRPMDPPPEISLEVEFTAEVPELNLTNEQIFLIRTGPFPLKGEISLTNRNIGNPTNTVTTLSGEQILIRTEQVEYIRGGRQEELINQVLETPNVPAGVYTFRFTVRSEDGRFSQPVSEIRSFEISDRSTVHLVMPPNNSRLHTPYPVFQWESPGTDAGCIYGLRVCEFDPQQHSSPEDALHDQSVLPYPDNGGYHRIEQTTSFQYPLEEAKDLESGQTYVWHVQKYCSTTRGEETVESEILSFTLGDRGGEHSEMILKTVLGESLYERLFGTGSRLAGYSMNTNEIMLNGEAISLSELMRISARFDAGERTIISTDIEE